MISANLLDVLVDESGSDFAAVMIMSVCCLRWSAPLVDFCTAAGCQQKHMLLNLRQAA